MNFGIVTSCVNQDGGYREVHEEQAEKVEKKVSFFESQKSPCWCLVLLLVR